MSFNTDSYWRKEISNDIDNAYQNGYEQGGADVMEKLNELKEHYADACCICTKMDCDVCDIKTFIEELEQIGAGE